MSKDFSFKDVSEHTTKKDLWLIVHDKVYDTTKFVDEHPGGEEVLLDVGGQDATEAFEDVGHSDEAREVLDGLLIGSLKRGPGDPAPSKGATEKVAAGPKPTSSDTGSGVMLYAALVLGAAIVYGAYTYMQNSDSK